MENTPPKPIQAADRKVYYIFLPIAGIILLIFIFLLRKNTPPTTKQLSVTPTTHQIAQTATLSFVPEKLITKAGPASVDIMVDTGGSAITGVQVELSYNAHDIASMKIKPAAGPDAFFDAGSIIPLKQSVDAAAGRISYSVGLSPNALPKKGRGKILSLSFIINSLFSSSTKISFLPHTLVTKEDETESILKEVNPLTIELH